MSAVTVPPAPALPAQRSASPRRISRAVFALLCLSAIMTLLLLLKPLNPSPDGRDYAYAAQTFSERGEFAVVVPETSRRVPDDFPRGEVAMTVWPPLYPLLLTIIPANVINAASYAAILFITSHLAALLFGPERRWTGAALVLLNMPLLYTHQFQLSEPPFMVLALASLCLLVEGKRRQNGRLLALATGLAALASLTRYSGMVLVGTGALWLLMSGRWRSALLFSFALMPVGMWMLRNYMLDGTLMGPRVPSSYGVVLNLVQILVIIGTWALLILPIAVLLRRGIGARVRRDALALLALFGGAYMLFMLYSASTVYFDLLASNFGRMLVPAALPLMLASLSLVQMFQYRQRMEREDTDGV